MTSARTAHSHVAQLRRLESAKQKRTHAPNPRVTKPCVSKACMSKPCVSNAHMNKPCVSKGMSGQVLCGPCMNGQARSFQQDTHSYSTARAPSFTQSALVHSRIFARFATLKRKVHIHHQTCKTGPAPPTYTAGGTHFAPSLAARLE